MGKYNFDEIADRRGSGCYKWSGPEDEIPMWIADMDFMAAPPIRAALQRSVDHGVFGYFDLPESWNEAYVSWWDKRHHVKLNAKDLIFVTGIVPAISSAVRKLTYPAEKVLVQTPCYNIFFNSIINNGRYVVENELVYDENSNTYSIDWKLLEEQLSDPQLTLMILCNPHNPIGQIWDKETLAKIGELCEKYHVIVFSDEIHCDLTAPGTEYVPFISASDTCRRISVTGLAPTKTFNLAGINTAAVYAENEVLHHKMWRGLNTDEVAEPNAFAVGATVAAFTECADWLDELREYVWANKDWFVEALAKECPKIKVYSEPATYLMWLDCSAVTDDAEALCAHMKEKHGLWLAAGGAYGKGGEKFIRLNAATNRATMEEGFKRFVAAVKSFK